MSLAVKAVGVRKSFGRLEVLKGLDLEVENGEVLCILGPSGSGKSTFLRCINHLEVPDNGYVWVDGAIMGYELHGNVLQELSIRHLRAQQSQLGMVFQHFNLFAHRTVLGNVIEGPMVVRGLRRAAAEARAMELLEQVGMAGKASSYPSQLSGGQKQRVAIARALAMEPRVMLFDEPTSALDPELVGEVLEVMRNLARGGTTMIVVTHEIGFAREVADRVVVMIDGEIREMGAPGQVLSNPSDSRVRTFLSRVLS
ncbi:amino acid ABC transporter ATP-binding protein [Rhizobium sp. KVB221]|uniref:Amino acid ABC transporter ATP-binding protein n=1 Tax=Rhizobium setariae TaxID=2801340 RepID=A0A937CPW3_9HYPH|nr:amino acid ABC transporter ATP-binding protein [Rhizobium setariae]MBL0373659.1 amino acid ABC transporter ATP-binding protein [Rhizobium setariae]